MEDYLIVLEPSSTGYAAFSPDIPGCIAVGKTVEKTLAEMRSALVFHLEGMLENGELIPTAKGLEHHINTGEYTFDPGDLLTTFPTGELLAELPVASVAG